MATWRWCPKAIEGVFGSPSVRCPACRGSGAVNVHLGVRIASRLAHTCLLVGDWASCCEGADCICRGQPTEPEWYRARAVVEAAEAYLADPTEEGVAAWAAAYAAADTPWVPSPSLVGDPLPEAQFRICVEEAEKILGGSAWTLAEEVWREEVGS